MKASEEACNAEEGGILAAAASGPKVSFGVGGGGGGATFGVGGATFGVQPAASCKPTQGFDPSIMAKYSQSNYDKIMQASEDACKNEEGDIFKAAAGAPQASFGVGGGGATFGVGGGVTFGAPAASSSATGIGAASFGIPVGAPKASFGVTSTSFGVPAAGADVPKASFGVGGGTSGKRKREEDDDEANPRLKVR